MLIEISEQLIDLWPALQSYEREHPELAGKHGACVVFAGRMRDFNEDDSVTRMHLEHYPGMTEKFLQQMVKTAIDKWQLMDALVIHRVGEITPADTIVVVAVWSTHRAHAYAANQFIMEALKSEAPFWKKETLTDGDTRWVKKNTPGTV